MLTRYPGKIPSNVNRDAKYSIIHEQGGEMVVQLIYRLGRNERALLTTGTHQRLVDMVNTVKEEAQRVPGGTFYINEHGHVIVPAEGGYYYAGKYDVLLEFRFES